MSVRPASAAPEEKAQVRVIRGAARRAVWLPFIGGVLLIVILTGLTLTFPDTRQTDLVANFLLVFVLCPAILCFLPVYFLLVAAAYGMHKVNEGVSKPLMRAERATASLGNRVADFSERAAKVSITFNAKMASIDRTLFSIFDERPEKRESTDGHSAERDEQPRG